MWVGRMGINFLIATKPGTSDIYILKNDKNKQAKVWKQVKVLLSAFVVEIFSVIV